MMWDYGYGFGWAGALLMVLWWALVVGGLVFLVRSLTTRTHPLGVSARGVLDDRFAAGKITAEEYRERRKVLDGS